MRTLKLSRGIPPASPVRRTICFLSTLAFSAILVGCGDDDGGQTGWDSGPGPDGWVDGGQTDGGSSPSDLFVATDGVDTGDCRLSPCRTLTYAAGQMQPSEVLEVGDGVYDDDIVADLFPSGTADAFTIIRAAYDGQVTISGEFMLFRNSDHFLQFEGLRFDSPTTKGVIGGNVRFYRTSFIGGPPAGNTVNFGVGTNDFYPGAWDILCEDCLFYGQGGRYSALIYRAVNVVLRRAVARKDGGWGEAGPSETEFEPEGVIIFYESADSSCQQCVVFDSLKLSDSSAEGLGALIQNSHDATLHNNVQFQECVVVNNSYSGFTFEGNGQVHNARISDSYSVGNAGNGVTANLIGGTLVVSRAAIVGNDYDGIADYRTMMITLEDCDIRDNQGEQLRNVTGQTDGPGPDPLDLGSLLGQRIRAEMCAGQTRGFCAFSGTFQEYLQTFRDR